MNRRFKEGRPSLSLSLSIFPPFLSFLSLGQGDGTRTRGETIKPLR